LVYFPIQGEKGDDEVEKKVYHPKDRLFLGHRSHICPLGWWDEDDENGKGKGKGKRKGKECYSHYRVQKGVFDWSVLAMVLLWLFFCWF
jgi:hypothetical protein